MSSARPVRITERDQRLLAFAAEHQFVLPSHIARVLETSPDTARRRCRQLEQAGYLTEHAVWAAEPPKFRITRRGLGAIGSDLRPPPRKLNLANYRHDAGLAWLAAAAQRGMFGAATEIVTDRRMRSHDGRTAEREERFGVRIGPGARPGADELHYPDLLLRTASGHRVAFELELTTKSRHRRERILSAYAADRRIDGVVYLTDSPSVARALQASVRRLGIADRVRVERVTFADGARAQAPGLTASRTASATAGRTASATARRTASPTVGRTAHATASATAGRAADRSAGHADSRATER